MRILVAAVVGALFGYVYPALLGIPNADSALCVTFAFKYALAAGMLAFFVERYLAVRQKLIDQALRERDD